MDITCIFFGVLFLLGGLAFAYGKGHIHLAAWKNMPQEEKEKINIEALCHNIGEVIALNGLIFLIKGMWPGFVNHWFVAAMVAWFVLASFDIWYIEKSGRYCKK